MLYINKGNYMQLNYEDINLQYFPEFSDFDQNFLDTGKKGEQ